MQPSTGRVAQLSEAAAAGEFFIPDLCAPRPVFTMVLLVELVVLVYTLSISALPDFNWDTLAIGSLFVQWVVLLSAAVLCMLRGGFRRFSLPLASTLCILVVLLVTALSSAIGWELLSSFGGDSSPGWWLLRNLLVATVLSGIVLRYFYLQQQLVLQKQLELRARLDSLRAKIRPHFLFNTLNSIASLIATRPELAERAVEDLAELLRVGLQDELRPTTVADELRLCELYLDIEKLRLGDRLQVQWQVDAAVRARAMPSLILQPLVENAVYHGVSQLAAGGTVTIEVREDRRVVRVTVANPVPEQGGHNGGHQMAVANIRQHLQALYGSEGRLELVRSGGQFRVELSYPPQERL